MRWLNFKLALGAIWCLSILSGCGAAERAQSIPYSITFDVAFDVNQGSNKIPSPIVLKVFQLKTASSFGRADFFMLQDRPESALGSDLIGVDRMILRPGDTRTLHSAGSPDAHAIGVIAEYRLIDKTRWRLAVPLSSTRHSFWRMSPRGMKLAILVRDDGIAFANDSQASQ
ncbi:type VI secretion system lipoprotein TssJ [Trinickia sp. LjRoot230]|uniref:type VI secretion system lipoprotein TssJ n=1 Tax=Trinickia sp. LjRoot230 TaxID=3342288 RepID=UPI003ECC4ADB